ncbi:MAG TPA: glycosyltransferase family 4 protein [Dongiaceae bacterium]
MRIVFIDPTTHDYNVETPFHTPFGGSQSSLCYLAIELAALGHEVSSVTETRDVGRFRGVECVGKRPGLEKGFLDRFDVIVMLNCALGIETRRVLRHDIRLVLWTQHADNQPAIATLSDAAERDSWSAFAFISSWQAETYRRRFGVPAERSVILRNAMAPAFAALPERPARDPAAPPLFAYTSTPFRGLDVLLDAWPAIRQGLPQARLRVFSSMAVYQKGGDADEYAALYERCRSLAGIDYVGSLAQPALAAALQASDALTYPSTFAETSCISAIEAIAAGCLVLTTDLGALKETTAGFARLLRLPPSRGDLAGLYAAMVVAEWQQAAASPAVQRARIAAQRDFMQRNATWSVRAPEWVAFLNRVVAEGR